MLRTSLFFRRFCWSKPRCKVTNFISNFQIFCVKNLLRTSLCFRRLCWSKPRCKINNFISNYQIFCVKNLLSISSYRRFKERFLSFCGCKGRYFFLHFPNFFISFFKVFLFRLIIRALQREKNKRFYGVLRCFRGLRL